MLKAATSQVAAGIAVAIALTVSACVPREKTPAVAFSAAVNEPYLKVGTGAVEGQAFLRQRGGGVVRCSGEPVLLFPATPFFREVVKNAKQGYRPGGIKLDPKFKGLARQSVCDSDGKFAFRSLPPGSWFVLTQVKWQVGYANQGGDLIKEISTSPHRTTTVILADSDEA
jgi:hypothetical protein